MVKFFKSLSKTLIITVALATFLSTAVQPQSVQAATSSASKGKGGTVTKKPTLTEDQKAAVAVDTKIARLPKFIKITLANEDAIIASNIAYNTLTDIQKPLVKPSNKSALIAAVNKIANLKIATDVNVLINALPKVDKLTLADETAVTEAYSAYKALSKSQKALLTPSNSGKITAAKNKIASLKRTTTNALSELNSGKKAFSNFVKAGVTGAVEENNTLYFAEIAKAKTAKGSDLTLEEVQVIVDTVNQAVVDLQAAQVVMNQIIALDNTKETYATDVNAAKEAYEMLTNEQRALVTNYDILVNAV